MSKQIFQKPQHPLYDTCPRKNEGSKLYEEIENIKTEFAALKNSLTYVKTIIEEKPDLSTWENCLP